MHPDPVDSLFPLRTPQLTLRPHGGEDPGDLLGRTGLDAPARALELVVEHAGRDVGEIALRAHDETGAVVHLAWTVGPDADGAHLTGEAVGAALDLAFGHYGVHRVVVEVDARDTASTQVCERLGMVREATLRRDRWSAGEWVDTAVYGALSTDRPRGVGEAIVVSAVVLDDAEGRVLTVRKRGTDLFMHPGGKPEGEESPAACAVREVFEELGLALAPEALELVAVHRTAAANEAGRALVATVFAHPHLRGATAPEVTPDAEIAEVRWLDPEAALPEDVAPLLRWLHAERLAARAVVGGSA